MAISSEAGLERRVQTSKVCPKVWFLVYVSQMIAKVSPILSCCKLKLASFIHHNFIISKVLFTALKIFDISL